MTHDRPFLPGEHVQYTTNWILCVNGGPRVNRTARELGSGVVVRAEDPWVVVQWGDGQDSQSEDLGPGEDRVHPANIAHPVTAKANDHGMNAPTGGITKRGDR